MPWRVKSGLTLDGELLDWSEAYARERGVSWTAVVEAGLRELQASAMSGVPDVGGVRQRADVYVERLSPVPLGPAQSDVGPGPVECEECGKTPRACWLPPHLCSHPERLSPGPVPLRPAQSPPELSGGSDDRAS
jgi:hypothetical protein